MKNLNIVSPMQLTGDRNLLTCLFQIKGNSQVQQLDGWDALYLDYKVEWPMGLLLTPQVMARQVGPLKEVIIINYAITRL